MRLLLFMLTILLKQSVYYAKLKFALMIKINQSDTPPKTGRPEGRPAVKANDFSL